MESLFICRAKRIDNGELVEGYYKQDIGFKKQICHWMLREVGRPMEIDPSTLEISFDNGKTFKPVSEYAEMESKVCENCEYFSILDMDGREDDEFGFPYCSQMIRDANKTFGCNQFQRKQDEG